MIAAAFQKFADNAPDFVVIAWFTGRDHELMRGREVVGWFRDQQEAEYAAKRASESFDCDRVAVLHASEYLPGIGATIVHYGRIECGEQFDQQASMQAIVTGHGMNAFVVGMLVIAPVIEHVLEQRQRQARRRRRPLPRPVISTSMEIAPCLH